MSASLNVRFAPILLKTSFLADEPDFSGPPMRFARGDVRDHNVLQSAITPKARAIAGIREHGPR
jgi:hypothetical protein